MNWINDHVWILAYLGDKFERSKHLPIIRWITFDNFKSILIRVLVGWWLFSALLILVGIAVHVLGYKNDDLAFLLHNIYWVLFPVLETRFKPYYMEKDD